MPRVWLDDEFHSHPKVIGAGLEAAGLFARALSYCGAYLTDGFVPGEWVAVVAAKHKKAPEKLVEVGLWKTEKGGYSIPDYLDYNDSKEEVLRYRAERSRSGKKGARRRWGGGKAAPPLFDDDGESHSSGHGESHSSSDSNSHGSRARAQGDGKTMARDRAATTNTTTTTPAAEDQELEGPAAALAEAEAPRETRVAQVVQSLRGADANSFNQVWPLSQQLDAASFEEAVSKVGQRRDVDNPVGLLIWFLEQAVGQRVRDQTADLHAGGPAVFVPREPPPDLDDFVRLMRRWRPEEFEQAFDKWGIEGEERIRLSDLVHDESKERAAS